MLRTISTAALALAAFGIITAPIASAAPKMCDNHGTGTGLIYKHACATGSGGGGSTIMVKDAFGHYVQVKHQDVLVGGWKP